jgi:hypothetical protein
MLFQSVPRMGEWVFKVMRRVQHNAGGLATRTWPSCHGRTSRRGASWQWPADIREARHAIAEHAAMHLIQIR